VYGPVAVRTCRPIGSLVVCANPLHRTSKYGYNFPIILCILWRNLGGQCAWPNLSQEFLGDKIPIRDPATIDQQVAFLLPLLTSRITPRWLEISITPSLVRPLPNIHQDGRLWQMGTFLSTNGNYRKQNVLFKLLNCTLLSETPGQFCTSQRSLDISR